MNYQNRATRTHCNLAARRSEKIDDNRRMAKDEEEDDLLPDKDAAKGFYGKYEPKEILGRLVFGENF